MLLFDCSMETVLFDQTVSRQNPIQMNLGRNQQT